MTAFPPMLNVAHVADSRGRCGRCGVLIGCFRELQDDGQTYVERPWLLGERVIEYDCADGRSRFADTVFGFAVDCQP